MKNKYWYVFIGLLLLLIGELYFKPVQRIKLKDDYKIFSQDTINVIYNDIDVIQDNRKLMYDLKRVNHNSSALDVFIARVELKRIKDVLINSSLEKIKNVKNEVLALRDSGSLSEDELSDLEFSLELYESLMDGKNYDSLYVGYERILNAYNERTK